MNLESLIFLCCLCGQMIGVMGKITLFPRPQFYQLQQSAFKFGNNGCPTLMFNLPEQSTLNGPDPIKYFHKILQRQYKQSKCSTYSFQALKFSQNGYKIFVSHNKSLPSEGYKIITSPENCTISISAYSGYVYAMQTLSQIINADQIFLGVIHDEPMVEYRGIMIDSVRHFIGIDYIQRLLMVMPLSKLNYLHWHMADDEAFVLELAGHPQLAKQSAYDDQSYYTLAQIKYILAIAQQNAVNIIPEFDTPAHVRSWGVSEQWKQKNITILCPKGQGYNHQFDLSKEEVFKLVEQVLVEVGNIFKNSHYLHLGGDQVFGSCWDQRPEIKQFMATKNISSYGQLQTYWRNQLKSKLPGRKLIFWRNDAAGLAIESADIVQFWGAQSDASKTIVLSNNTNKIILSPSDYLYLNKGQSFIWQNTTGGKYVTWRQIYQQFVVFPAGIDRQRILGAQVCLWGQVSNQDTFQNNLWTRASSFGAKVWNQNMYQTHELVSALYQIQQNLKQYGVAPSPIVPQYCEKNPQICFPSKKETQEIVQE